MKFLLISPFTSVSGSAIRFWHIAQHLQWQGNQVVYVERHPRGAPPPMLLNVRYHSTPQYTNLYLDIAISTLHNIYVLISNLDCQVVYALKPAPNNFLPSMLARLLGKLVLLDVDDLDWGYYEPGLKRSVSKFFFDVFPRISHLVTFHTPALQSYLVEQMGVDPSKTYFLKQGVSDAFFSFENTSIRAKREKSIIYMATLGITSDFADLIPVFIYVCSKCPSVSISVVGDGVRKESFMEMVCVAGCGDNFNFLGRIPHNQMPQVIASHCIGVNYLRPSLTNGCRAVLKLREYLSMSLHVVCNSVGDAYAFHKHIHMEDDLRVMGERIVEILKKRPVPNSAGREFVLREFGWKRIMSDFAEELRIKGMVQK